METVERESMEFDVVIVGGGPAGLSAACKLMQTAEAAGTELQVCLVEKGSEIGAHILSGAVIEPRALDELFPDWAERGAPLNNPVTADQVYWLPNDRNRVKIPSAMVPKATHNDGNHAVSLGNLCRWLGEQAEALGAMVFPGFAASEVLFHDDGSIKGIRTTDMGVDANGEPKANFTPGYELHAKYTIFAEGCRGNLGKQLMDRFDLHEDSATQHYAIGLKELWDVAPDKYQQGKVVHTLGWPLTETGTTGGSFLYHLEGGQVALGLIVDLSYSNPHVDPFQELQRFKRHPLVSDTLEGGQRVSYGARALTKGGIQALPKLSLRGAVITGDDAGFLNFLKIKGSHTAMKSGMLAAEAIFDKLQAGSEGREEVPEYSERFRASWLHDELRASRNAGPAMHKFGMFLGSAYTWVEQSIFAGKVPFTLTDPTPDHAKLKPAEACKKPQYPRPDNRITFDRLGSVFISNTNHGENQPGHLLLKDPDIPIQHNLPVYDEPAQRYCPASVYEVVEENGERRFQINAQNCVHCKTCDIKDPAQNIEWTVPEGGDGPNYPNM